MNRKRVEFIVILFLCCGFGWYAWSVCSATDEAQLQVVMLDIGQGDAIYIRTPDGTDILVDGGPDRTVLHELGSVMPPWDHTVELVVATHADADHIAGLTEIPDAYEVKTLVTSGVEKETGFSEALSSWEEARGVKVVQAQRGWALELEPDCWLEFLHPDPGRFHKDINDDSVVFLLHYGDFHALFTGDVSIEIEEELLEHTQLSTVDLDLLKAGHHGSRTSSGEALLHATTPEVVLVSVGAGNKFGHPHPEPMRLFHGSGAAIYRSDQHGRVKCLTNGADFTCNPEVE